MGNIGIKWIYRSEIISFYCTLYISCECNGCARSLPVNLLNKVNYNKYIQYKLRDNYINVTTSYKICYVTILDKKKSLLK